MTITEAILIPLLLALSAAVGYQRYQVWKLTNRLNNVFKRIQEIIDMEVEK